MYKFSKNSYKSNNYMDFLNKGLQMQSRKKIIRSRFRFSTESNFKEKMEFVNFLIYLSQYIAIPQFFCGIHN